MSVQGGGGVEALSLAFSVVPCPCPPLNCFSSRPSWGTPSCLERQTGIISWGQLVPGAQLPLKRSRVSAGACRESLKGW